MTQTPQDLVEVEATRKEVVGDLDLVTLVFPKGTADYYHSTLILASKLVKARDLDGAMAMLRSIPYRYYVDEMPKRMEIDPLFCATACKVADAFVEIGMVTSPVYNIPEKLFLQQAAQA